LFQTVSDNKIPITHPAVGDTFSLGSANISILGPINNSYDEENNYSLIIRITHDTTSYIITGDATYLSENEVVKKYGNELNSDVYIVGHHGSVSSSSIKFLKAVSPEYSIISVGSENEYGHPHKEVISRLQAINSEIYRTDISGTITMESSEDKGFSIHAALEE
jgi:competence protein ComEC